MDSGSGEGDEGAAKNEKSNNSEAKNGLVSDAKSERKRDLFFRADKIDFKSWDIQLEKHLSRVWSRDREVHSRKQEEWEIDLAT